MAGAAGDVAAAKKALDDAVADVTDEGIDADANGSDDAALTGGTGAGTDSREPFKIPGHSHWFRWDATHELERRGVPEFFDGRSETKTPEAYAKIRATMMNQYRVAKKAGERLSFTKARRGSSGTSTRFSACLISSSGEPDQLAAEDRRGESRRLGRQRPSRRRGGRDASGETRSRDVQRRERGSVQVSLFLFSYGQFD